MRQRWATASLLLHPLFLAALAVLWLNDHVLKERWPGLVTGKLSDVAGPVVVAFVIATISGRRDVAVGGTALGFTALKLSPAVAVLAAPVLGGVTRTDPTDLVGLVALVPTWFVLGPPSDPAVDSTAPPPTRPQARPLGPARSVGLVAVSLLTVFSVTATSCDDERLGFHGLVVTDDGVIAQLGDDRTEPSASWFSDDGGRSWQPTSASDLALEGGGGLDPAAPRPGRTVQETEVCLDDGRCFRAMEGDRIEERVDGEWQTSFRFTDEQVARIERRGDGCSGTGDVSHLYAALAAVDTSDGASAENGNADQTVVATMGPQGVLRIDPATGAWQRIGIGRHQPISLFGPRWLFWLTFSPILAIAATPVLLLVNRRKNVSANRRAVAVILNVVLSLLFGGLMLGLLVLSLGRLDYAFSGLFSAGVSLLIFVIALIVVLPPGKPTAATAPPLR